MFETPSKHVKLDGFVFLLDECEEPFLVWCTATGKELRRGQLIMTTERAPKDFGPGPGIIGRVVGFNLPKGNCTSNDLVLVRFSSEPHNMHMAFYEVTGEIIPPRGKTKRYRKAQIGSRIFSAYEVH